MPWTPLPRHACGATSGGSRPAGSARPVAGWLAESAHPARSSPGAAAAATSAAAPGARPASAGRAKILTISGRSRSICARRSARCLRIASISALGASWPGQGAKQIRHLRRPSRDLGHRDRRRGGQAAAQSWPGAPGRSPRRRRAGRAGRASKAAARRERTSCGAACPCSGTERSDGTSFGSARSRDRLQRRCDVSAERVDQPARSVPRASARPGLPTGQSGARRPLTHVRAARHGGPDGSGYRSAAMVEALEDGPALAPRTACGRAATSGRRATPSAVGALRSSRCASARGALSPRDVVHGAGTISAPVTVRAMMGPGAVTCAMRCVLS